MAITYSLTFLRTQSRLTADGRGGVRIDHGEYSDSTEGGDEDEVNASQQYFQCNVAITFVNIRSLLDLVESWATSFLLKFTSSNLEPGYV